jgi:predicted anti-sigma-YlaC factor YlaD
MNWPSKMIKSLGKGIALLFPDCRDASRLQSATLDRQLSAVQRFGLKFHLLFCKWCRRYGKQIRFLHKASHQFGEPECSHPPQILSAEARQRMLEKLKAEGK